MFHTTIFKSLEDVYGNCCYRNGPYVTILYNINILLLLIILYTHGYFVSFIKF
jgi:hypothetical protein